MPNWMTQKEAQEYLGVSRTTLYRWRKEGRLKAYTAGKVTRYRQEDLDAALEPETVDTED